MEEPILLAFRRRVCRLGRVRRDCREVRDVIWFPERSREWTVGGRLLVLEVDSQASSSLLARMRVCSDGNDLVTVAISSALSSVSVSPKYRILRYRESVSIL